MPLLEDNTEAFIVRIWLEWREIKEDAECRGVVLHVSSGRRRYCRSLVEAVEFMAEYVKALGCSNFVANDVMQERPEQE